MWIFNMLSLFRDKSWVHPQLRGVVDWIRYEVLL